MERINFCLRENEAKRAKLQKKKIDIYETFSEERFDIGYVTICSDIRNIKKGG